MLSNVIALYQVDGLRADGYTVRFARLNMIDTHVTPILLLCWLMEGFFALAFFNRGIIRPIAIASFWFAYLGILAQVY